MKKNLLLPSILMLLTLHSNADVYKQEQLPHTPTDILDSIQFKIEKAMYASFADGNTEALSEIFTQLNSIEPKNNIITYWIVH